MCGKLKILLSHIPGQDWRMSIPDEDYWNASVPVPRHADQDQAIANIHRRFPDAEISVTYPWPMA
jgi:hypothetical protein